MTSQRVAIVGLGLIGASLGLALHRLRPAPQVVGYDRDRDTARRAARGKAVDRVGDDAISADARG
jgi:prephenate dehydrogenase